MCVKHICLIIQKRFINTWPFKHGIAAYTEFLHVLEKTRCLQLFLPLYDRNCMFLVLQRLQASCLSKLCEICLDVWKILSMF